MKKRVRVSAALATGPTRTGNNSESSGTVSEATRHPGAVQTIADETGERAHSGRISDRDASTGHHAVHGAAYLPVCALPSSPASTANNHTRDSSSLHRPSWLPQAYQFSVGRSARSTMRTSTCCIPDSSLKPSCSRRAVNIDAASGSEGGGGAPAAATGTSGVQSIWNS
jgi:hypothetical protein